MTEYRVRAAIFGDRRAVYYPSGREHGTKKKGFPNVPPPPYKPPPEKIFVASSFAQARQLVRELKLEHGDRVVIHVEPIETAPADPRPAQTSLAEIGGWPRQR